MPAPGDVFTTTMGSQDRHSHFVVRLSLQKAKSSCVDQKRIHRQTGNLESLRRRHDAMPDRQRPQHQRAMRRQRLPTRHPLGFRDRPV
jgi:hypothetical protein